MVDEGRVVRLLRGITDRTRRLDAAYGSDRSVRGELWLDGIKYLLVTTVESVVDVAQHVGSSEGFGAPDSNADAVRSLGLNGVIEADLAERLATAVGFRNVLVHQYAEVDDEIVLHAVDRLAEFTRFVSQTSAWLAERRA